MGRRNQNTATSAIGDADNPATQQLAVNIAGQASVTTEGAKASYSAAILNVALSATATDIFAIFGTAAKIVRVTRLTMAAVATAATVTDIVLMKRSLADGGGVSIAVPAVPHDSTSAAAGATVFAYTTSPSQGTAIGKLRAEKLAFAAAGAPPVDRVELTFGVRNAQSIVLRGTECLALNMNGTAPAGATADFEIEWTEE
jgi:hypothetical protein